MTKEEAINLRQGRYTGSEQWQRQQALADIENWVELGMLKLDEPRGLPQKLREFVFDARLVQGDAMMRLENLQLVLRDCDLKIVEK